MNDYTDECEDDVAAPAEPSCPWCNGMLFPKFSACFDCCRVMHEGERPPSTGWRGVVIRVAA